MMSREMEEGSSPSGFSRVAVGGVFRPTGQAAGFGADVVFGGHFPDGAAGGKVEQSFLDELAEHGGKPGVVAGGFCPDHGDAKFFGKFPGLGVEIEEDFHVVGEESDGRDDDIVDALGVEVAEMVEDVGLEPGLGGGAAPALVDEAPGGSVCGGGGEFGCVAELGFVFAVVGHGEGNAMGGKGNMHSGPARFREGVEGIEDAVAVDVDEVGVIKEDADFVEGGRVGPGGVAGALDVFAVLAAAGVATERGGGEYEEPPDTRFAHVAEGVADHGVPVPVAEVDGQGDAGAVEFGAEVGDDGAVLLVDGADPAEAFVVMGDFEFAFFGHVAATEDVVEEGHDVVHSFGAAEGHDENGIVFPGGVHEVQHTRYGRSCKQSRARGRWFRAHP